jgi:hypothetical protein
VMTALGSFPASVETTQVLTAICDLIRAIVEQNGRPDGPCRTARRELPEIGEDATAPEAPYTPEGKQGA